MKAYINLLLFNFLILSGNSFSYEKSEAFIVVASPKNFKVIAPTEHHNKISVIIKNSMLSNLVGKIIFEKNKKVIPVSIKKGSRKSYTLEFAKGDKPMLIPLSPPFQKVELLIGKRPYEIPPKEKK